MKSSVRYLVTLNIFRPDVYNGVFIFLQTQTKAEWPTDSPFQWNQTMICKSFLRRSGADPGGRAI